MEFWYWHSYSRLCNIISIFLVVACCNFICTEAKNPFRKSFICSVNVFDQPTTSYINCTFRLDYTGELITKCPEKNVNGLMVVIIHHTTSNSERVKLPLNGTEEKLEVSSPIIRCVSNMALNIHAKVLQESDLAHFTDISSSRIFSPSLNTTQYIYNVRLLQFKKYLSTFWSTNIFFGAIHYHIFPRQIQDNNINIMIGNLNLDETIDTHCSLPWCGPSICKNDFSLTNLLAKEFVDIQIPISSVKPFILKKICNFESNFSRCSNTVTTRPPAICLAVQELKIRLDTQSKTITLNGSIHQNEIPFLIIYDALKLKSDKLQIVDLDNISDEDMDKLAESFQNQTDRPFAVSRNDYVAFDSLERFLNFLNKNEAHNCGSQQQLTFNQLQFVLQLLGIEEILIGRKEELSFTPLLGFKIRSQLLLDYGPGKYTVRRRRPSCDRFLPISIDLQFSPHPHGRIQFVPLPKYDIFTREYSTKFLALACPSTTINGTIILEGNIFNTTRLFHHENLSNRHGFRSFSLAHVYLPSIALGSSTLQCSTLDKYQWTIENYDPRYPTLKYEPKDNRFVCQGNLNHWKCKNRMQCQAVAFSCIQDITKESVPDGSQGSADQFGKGGVVYNLFCMTTLYDSNIEGCWALDDPDLSLGHRCKWAKPSPMGIIQCISPFQLRETHFIYFRGFDDILYVDGDMKGPPPKEAVLKLTTTSNENIFYTKQKYTFRCDSHSFFYDDGIWWLLKYKNGTNLRPADGIVSDGHESNDTVYNSKRELTLAIDDTSLKEVICFAPYVHNLDFNNVSIAIHILESIAPKITSSNTDIGFTDNATDQSFSCAASGRPSPKISWKRNNKEIQEPLRILDGHTLYFPIYQFNLSGEYVCTATNVAGNDTKSFFVQEKKAHSNNNPLIIGVVASFAIFLSILFLIYLTNERIKRYREMREVINLLNGRKPSTENSNEVDGEDYQTNFLFDTNYEILKNTFLIDQRILLGKGEFGEVYRGLLQHRNEAVAFKTVRPNAGIQHLKALVSEAKILMYIGSHEHLVILLGIYRQEIKSGILYVAIEYCELGSLESFLRKHHKCFEDSKVLNTNYVNQNGSKDRRGSRKRIPSGDELIRSLCTVQNLLVWSEEIASAMEYLGTKNVIHSDLATRNVLLTSEGIAKVTDFGLSRRTYSYSEYIKTAKDPLPWRWLAIESLRTNTFSTKSDVWGYGILLWEIFSLGDIPYPGMSPTMEFVQELENGLRNCKPKWASDETYNIMVRCWHLDPEQRPTFSSIRKIFNHATYNGWTGLSDEISHGTTLEDIVVKLASSEYLEI